MSSGRAPSGAPEDPGCRPAPGGVWIRAVVPSVLAAAVSAVLWFALRPTGMVVAPLWTQLVSWALIVAVRSDEVQRALGRGGRRMDDRVWLRTGLGCSLFALAVAPSGLAFLFPPCAAVVVGLHLHRSGSRAWRAGVVLTVLLTALVQVTAPLLAGATVVSVPVGVSLTVITLGMAMASVINTASLTAERERLSTALEVERTVREDERRRRQAELEHAATHDALTGLLNRAGLHGRLDAVVQGAVVAQGVGVVFIDLDGFKAVNDGEGHAAGDHLLRLVAQRLTGAVRPGDQVARTGGDEFVALLAPVEDRAALDAVADRAVEALGRPFDLGGVRVQISGSAGTAFVRDEVLTGEDLLHRADTAMYAVKAERKALSARTRPDVVPPDAAHPGGEDPAPARDAP